LETPKKQGKKAVKTIEKGYKLTPPKIVPSPVEKRRGFKLLLFQKYG